MIGRITQMTNRITFLDGLRGIAVLLVVFFHMGLNTFGFAGVELFFVISGFIITLLLISEYDKTGKISIIQFFVRRINRLFPPLIAILLVVLVLFINFPIAGITNEVFSQAKWTSFLSSNWYEIIHQAGYWEQGVKSPLLHTWSLSLEFQFYLLWPFLVAFFLRIAKGNKNKLMALFIALFIILTGITIYLSYFMTFSAIYYNTVTRMPSFVSGALGSVLVFRSEKKESFVHSFLFILLTVALGFLTVKFSLNDLSIFRGFITLYSIGFASLIVLLWKTESKLRAFLFENPVILFFGKISYSLYLVHMPVIAFLTDIKLAQLLKMDQPMSILELNMVQFFVSLVIGTLFWFIFENLMKSKSTIVALFLLISLPATVKIISEHQGQFRLYQDTREIDPKWINWDPVTTEGQVPVLVIGDSWSRRTAMGLYYAQEDLNIKPFAVLSYGLGNASIMPDTQFIEKDGSKTPGKFSFNDFNGYLNYWLSAAQKHHPKKIVIELGHADQHLQKVQGKTMSVGDEAFDALFIQNFTTLVKKLQETKAEIYIMNVKDNALNPNDKEANVKRSDPMNKNIQAVLKANPTAHLLDVHSLQSRNGVTPRILDGVAMYDETGHTSFEGSLVVGRWLLQELEKDKL